MSKQKIIGIVAVLSLAFAFISLNQIPTHAIAWDDGWTISSPYETAGSSYKGTASPTAAMTTAELTNQKSLLQTIAGVSITTQPQDQSVAWPAGATFTVELNNPEEKAPPLSMVHE